MLQYSKYIVIMILMMWASSSGGWAQNAFDISYVDIDFCDGANKLTLSGDATSLNQFCFVLSNLSNTPGDIALQLVDGEMTLGDSPVQACKTSSEGFFAQFVSVDAPAIIGTIPGSGLIYTGTISLPEGFAGNLYGCLTIAIPTGTGEDGSMFTIVNRKANLINIAVAGEYINTLRIIDPRKSAQLKVINQHTQSHMSAENDLLGLRDTHIWRVSPVLFLQNSGYVAEQYTITGAVTVSLYGWNLYQTEFTIQQDGIIYGGDSVLLQDTHIQLPWWVFGTLHLDVSAIHEPFEASELLSDTYQTQRNNTIQLAIYPHRYIIYGLGGILVLLLLLIFMKIRKKRQQKKTNKRKAAPGAPKTAS